MGVINRTPNSFSDNGLSLKSDYFHHQLQSFLKDQSVIIDVGFESTAPMNSAITKDLELSRFADFLLESKLHSFTGRFISFDTYRPESFMEMAQKFSEIHPDAGYIFNDVSGILDDELKEVLLRFKDKNFYYIYTFSHIPGRVKVLDHMKYLDEEHDILKQTSIAFSRAYLFFKALNMEHQLILDPGFGFSKTFEQNWRLIDCFNELESLLELEVRKLPCLIGVSKKSFLKKRLMDRPGQGLEDLHLEVILKLRKSSGQKLLFRVHDPKIMHKTL